MKLFLKKLSLFLLIFAGYSGVNWCLNSVIFQKASIPLARKEFLIAGDSHPQKAIDPGYFASAGNIAQTAEPYIVTYWKLEYLFKYQKPSVLLLGFGHQNISAFNDLTLWDKRWATELFQRIYPLCYTAMDDPGIKTNQFELAKVYFKNMCLYPHGSHYKFIGAYSNVEYSQLTNFEEAINRRFYSQGIPLGVSETSIQYLNRIADLCKKYNIALVLVGTPVHEEYYNKIPQPIKKRYESEVLRMRSEGIPVLDLTRSHYQDDHYLDADHLNSRGAKQFTIELITMLSRNADFSLLPKNEQSKGSA